MAEMGFYHFLSIEVLFIIQGFPGGSDDKESSYNQVQYLGQEDPWRRKMASHSSILAWRIPWIE